MISTAFSSFLTLLEKMVCGPCKFRRKRRGDKLMVKAKNLISSWTKVSREPMMMLALVIGSSSDIYTDNTHSNIWLVMTTQSTYCIYFKLVIRTMRYYVLLAELKICDYIAL
jgi:hypothetical protein